MKRKSVEVDCIVLHKKNGSIEPLFVVYDDIKYPVQVKEIKRSGEIYGSKRTGLRYTVIVSGVHRRYLYLEDGIWTIENPEY